MTALRRYFSLLSLSFSPLLWAAPQVEHFTLPSGLSVMLVQQAALPMLDASVDFDGGHLADPSDKTGLAELSQQLASLAHSGLDEVALAERLAFLGSSLSGFIEAERSGLRFRSLSAHAPEMMKHLAQLAAQSSIKTESFEREKNRMAQALKEALTQPGAVLSQQLWRLSQGREPTSVASLERISLADVQQHLQQHWRLNRARLSLVGALDLKAAKALAAAFEREFAHAAGASAGATATAPYRFKPVNSRINFPSQQAHLALVGSGISRTDPDFYPLVVANHILGGGGFGSRLMDEVREKRGLVYSIYSSLNPQRDNGSLSIQLETSSHQADEALQVVADTTAALLKQPPSKAEVEQAKTFLRRSFVLRYDSNRKLIQLLSAVHFYGLGLGYFDDYPRQLAQVTPAQVADVLKRYFDLNHFARVHVGP